MDIGKIGVMICYDGGFQRFHEYLHFMVLNSFCVHLRSLFGTKICGISILYPGRWKMRALWQREQIGTEGNIHMFGNNKLANPRGKLLLMQSVIKKKCK